MISWKHDDILIIAAVRIVTALRMIRDNKVVILSVQKESWGLCPIGCESVRSQFIKITTSSLIFDLLNETREEHGNHVGTKAKLASHV